MQRPPAGPDLAEPTRARRGARHALVAGVVALACAGQVLVAPAADAVTGIPDTGFLSAIGSGPNGGTQDSAPTGDGGLVVVGSFTAFDGVPVGRIAKLDATGALDTTFATNVGSGLDSTVSAVAVQPDGAVIVGGYFATASGVPAAGLARYLADGTLDTTFATNLGTGFDAPPWAIAVQSDGAIVVGGIFSTVSGIASSRLARLGSDGTPDAAFATTLGTGFNDNVFAVEVEADDDIVVGGALGTLDGSPVSQLVRLGPDGVLDTAFTTNVGTIGSYVYALAIGPDGEIITRGDWSYVAGTRAGRIARFLPNGTRDETFRANAGSGFNQFVEGVAIDAAGDVVLGSGFTSYNGSPAYRIARLHADGTRDTAFSTVVSPGANNAIYDVELDTVGRIVLAGNLSSLAGQAVPFLARLTDPLPDAPGVPTAVAGDGEATVTAVAATTGTPATAHEVTAVGVPGATCTATLPATSCTVTGLPNGVPVTFTAVAVNAGGRSAASAPSIAVTPQVPAPGTPGAPAAVAGDGSATVTVTPPASGGAPDSYTVTAVGGPATCTVLAPATSCTVTGLANGVPVAFTVTATDGGTSPASPASVPVTPSAAVTPPPPPPPPTTPGHGASGPAPGGQAVAIVDGTVARIPSSAPSGVAVVGGAYTPDRTGSWTASAAGRVFASGTAAVHGGLTMTPNGAVVAIAPTVTGGGYWLAAADGGVFAFGNAAFHGSLAGARLAQPIVGVAPTCDDGGYWLVGADGGVFAFGNAAFHGSMGGVRLNQPIVGLTPTATCDGYWLLGADGGVFAFGDAAFHGGLAGTGAAATVLAAQPAAGYWIADAAGIAHALPA